MILILLYDKLITGLRYYKFDLFHSVKNSKFYLQFLCKIFFILEIKFKIARYWKITAIYFDKIV